MRRLSPKSLTFHIDRRHKTMTSTAPPAPWRALFLDHVNTTSNNGAEPMEFTLATLHPLPLPSSPSPPSPPAQTYVPRARTCVFRGMFGTLPPNERNTAPRNREGVDSDMVAFTTDARMAKVPDFFGAAAPRAGTLGSGGGGPVEAVFWAPGRKGEGEGEGERGKEVMTQWRIRGEAYVVGPDIEGGDEGPGEGERGREWGEEKLKRFLLSQMRDATGEGGEGFSFAREVTAHFGNLGPLMRGSFANPPPGTPISSEGTDDPAERVGRRVEDLHDPVARGNFRVVIIVPREVDQVDLRDPQRPRRWLYRRVRAEPGGGDDGLVGGEGKAKEAGRVRDGQWEKIEVWP
ncbi:hypothetical protein SODALDRAFT_8875 [Sodiomyces alkalinus F11]|uniref:Pyridoxamine 5'-phosphate oxidase Alr4036 family FMN-binding domain-containing protein n=1 Tax=Sodiomyces alkalinus (strain CBS 110278 / VKM F-3762 / F11) TaxID=1314773 RepID=A0A3N2Q5U8_SODAK|nr:hypothetical protein SODALDRAFT_8875 [Sodiomyces alkalinus F11]ROT42159.1 hypothetical protein SODALDRAFT_8875 [Sodiomyces alkalinus F11]